MQDNENILRFAAGIRHLTAALKSLAVTTDDSKMAMILLNGLPGRCDTLTSALDAAHTDGKLFPFKFVQSHCLQEEQRHIQRDRDYLTHAKTTALLTTQSKKKTKRFKENLCSLQQASAELS